MRTRHLCAAAAILGLVLAGCGEKLDPAGDGGGCELPDQVTWSEHIEPLVSQYCTGCHASHLTGEYRNGAPAGVDFDTYELTVDNADDANDRIGAGTMPPSAPLDPCHQELFDAWVAAGTPE